MSSTGAFGAESRAARIAYTVRASVAAAIATAVWQGLELTHGIWLAISAIMVLQPRRDQTWTKGANRIVGTFIGAAVATAFAAVLPANALTIGGAVGVTILLCWSSGRLHDPMPLAALTTVLVFTFDRQEDALVAGLLRCAEIVAGVALGLVLTAIPLPGETA